MLTNRIEQTQIRKGHPLYKLIDEYCFRSKNLYNAANYIIRQEYIKNKKWIRYYELDKMLHQTKEYKALMSQASQCTLQVLDRNWKSFFAAIKDYNKHPEKYLGRPRLPKYKKKDGRFTWFLKNNQTSIDDGYLRFHLNIFNGYKFKTSANGRLIAVRFVPRGDIYVMEIIYEIEVPETKEQNNHICSIDLGVNNFVTMTNNIGLQPIIINGKGIKSVNQFYNKRLANLKSDLKRRNNKDWSNKLDKLTLKRNNKTKNFIHHVSKFIIKYCIDNNINTLVVGLNKTWKQESHINKAANQNFIFLPYDMVIQQLQYKSQNKGIKFITTEENFTSGTSFLDDETPTEENYNKSRRIHRGLFKSNTGKLINSDVNGSLQIMKKVFPNAFADGIEGSLTPVILNVVKTTQLVTNDIAKCQ